MTNRALIILDVQNDFCEGGALAVEGGARVASNISEFLDNESFNYSYVFATRDTHAALPNDNCGHFATDKEPDFDKSWPVHCVADTKGARFHSNLKISDIDVFLTKGYGCQSYSGFEAVDVHGTSLLAWLRSHEIDEVDICGLAFDYCVKSTAIDAAALGFIPTILFNLTAAVHPDNVLEEISELTKLGVGFA